MLKSLFMLFMLFGVFSNAVDKYPAGDFFFPDRTKVVMKMEEFERKVCSTDTTKNKVKFSEPRYTLHVQLPYDQVAEEQIDPIYSIHPKDFLFNFDRVGVYGDDYMYNGYGIEGQTFCFNGNPGDLILDFQKITNDTLSKSENCYNWQEEQINGKTVLCGTAIVQKKVLWIPKPIEVAEALVREYCGTSVNINPDLIDETKARTCVRNLDYNDLVGITNTSPNKFEF